MIRVLIVDDSAVSRELLGHILSQDSDIKIAGFAESGEEAIKWLSRQSADVVTMDINMPGINGFETTRKIMETKPVPIAIISGIFRSQDQQQLFQAMEAGALAILEKPKYGDENYELRSNEIISTIKTISEVKLVKRRSLAINEPVKATTHFESFSKSSIECIAIGASLGGPPVLSTILSKLSLHFPVPIFIVQHIAPGFVQGLATWLQSSSQLKIRLAADGEAAVPGTCYIAPDMCQMEVRKRGIISLIRTKLQPSVGELFKSIADTYESNAAGVILTGMGKDGASGLLAMRQKGAYTIAQDEKSCVVFGMPGEAGMLGAVRQFASPEQIADLLNSLVLNPQRE